mmetsp:Transcript_8509/g.21151  ORF Transcript_8509/g.21151 Transcript_8509/m.21151 type:complete len:518 (+) Transcript_8509:971-2524(+)
MRRAPAVKHVQRRGLRPDADLAPVGQQLGGIHCLGNLVGENVPVAERHQQVVRPLERHQQRRARNRVAAQRLDPQRLQRRQSNDPHTNLPPHPHRADIRHRRRVRPQRAHTQARNLEIQLRMALLHQLLLRRLDLQVNQIPPGRRQHHLPHVSRPHRDPVPCRGRPLVHRQHRRAINEPRGLRGDLHEQVPDDVPREQRGHIRVEPRQRSLDHLLRADELQHPGLRGKRLDQVRVEAIRAEPLHGKDLLDALQLDGRHLRDADAVPNHAQAAVLERAGARDELPLSLALEVDDAEVDDGAQIRVRVDDLEVVPRLRVALRAQLDELAVAEGGAHEDVAVVEIAHVRRDGRDAEVLHLESGDDLPVVLQHQHEQAPHVVAQQHARAVLVDLRDGPHDAGLHGDGLVEAVAGEVREGLLGDDDDAAEGHGDRHELARGALEVVHGPGALRDVFFRERDREGLDVADRLDVRRFGVEDGEGGGRGRGAVEKDDVADRLVQPDVEGLLLVVRADDLEETLV